MNALANHNMQMRMFCQELQQKIITELLEKYEGPGTVLQDAWQRPDKKGDGLSCLIEGGKVIERGGVNYSFIEGDQLPPSATALRPELAGKGFQAQGISCVIHPRNPYVPTTHFNVRMMTAEGPNNSIVGWFGGGFDLTPYYGFEEDARHWHQQAKAACDAFEPDLYPSLKKACDGYFFLPHRNEPRGIGGILFDDFQPWEWERCFSFVKKVGEAFVKAYTPILAKRKDTVYGERERNFQLYRRGRYVEFNLVYDRGTLFGFQSRGRIESILMSMPPLVEWKYNWQPEKGTAEAVLYEKFLVEKDWV